MRNFSILRTNRTWKRLAVAVVIAGSLVLIIWWLVRPLWLTQQYGPELREGILKHVEVIGTAAGQQDPTVMAQVATGASLDSLVESRCKKCPTLLIDKKADVKILQVLSYSAESSEVIARVEVGWYPVATETGAAVGKCHAQAYTIHVILLRDDDVWKVAEGKDVDANRIDDSADLLAAYCGSN